MTNKMGRRALLRSGIAMLGGAMAARIASAQTQGFAAKDSGAKTFEFMVREHRLPAQRRQGAAGAGLSAGRDRPVPGRLQVHGGAWNAKDRTDGQNTALDLAAAGIVIVSIDFRNAPEAPYPASLQDINYGIRWLKAHAGEFGSSAERVGAYGTSSGGHQILLAAIRPDDPRYRALPLAEAPDMDARLAFVVSGWAVLYPLERLKLAAEQNKQELVKSHATFFGNDETHLEATPTLAIERGEKLYFPPALVFQGPRDEWTTVRWRSSSWPRPTAAAVASWT